MEKLDLCGDMYYVKAEYKEKFLNTVEKYKIEWSGENTWIKYPFFLRYRKCDFSGEVFKSDDLVFCLYVIKLK